MSYDPEKHHRRSTRLSAWDYARGASYFVTLCTANREPLFGDIVDGVMRLSLEGAIVEEKWCRSESLRSNVRLDVFVMMPNHLHGIITIEELNNDVAVSPRIVSRPHGVRSGSLGAIIGQFKSAATRRINVQLDTPGAVVWQRNYCDHIIRDLSDFLRIRRYIAMNPFRWHEDEENPTTHR